MQKYSEEQFINVGSGREITIRQLAELVRRVVGYTGEIVWDTSKPDGTPRKLMDSSRLFAMGWRPQVDLETGIRRTYEDFLRRPPSGK
jgi:GDP-L-fucose synthase